MISIVIPALNEAEGIGPTLAAVARQQGEREVIVVDGGSRDATVEVAAAVPGVQVVASERGRGRQMNAGARLARGDILLFLHADTTLPEGALAAVAAAVAGGAAYGGFRKRYGDGSTVLAALACVLNGVRSARGRHLVGTQAIFMRRDAFAALGGYREWPLLEDTELSDRLRACGPMALLALTVTSSARRYRRRGIWRQILTNALILALYRLGVGPQRLRRLY